VTSIVAHRAGNDLTHLEEAERLGVAFVEADVRLWRGRLEVRHLKTLGPLPILWDRWRLGNPFAPRLELRDVLASAHPGTHFLLDLKGRRARLGELVLDALLRDRPVTVCARSRRLLAPFIGLEGVHVFQSVGSRRQLKALLRTADGLLLDGVSIHARLLDEEVLADLRRRTSTVFSWPVNSVQRAQQLVSLGVDGLISDRPEILAEGRT
jgi:glycerophosphoryl diester phosphodiesterase